MIRRRETARLFCCFRPLHYSFFRTCSLKTGLLLSAVVDILIGLATLAAVAKLLPQELRLHGSELAQGLWILAIPFATLGVIGANTAHRAKVDLYSGFKRCEWVAVCGLCVWRSIEEVESWETLSWMLCFSCLRLGFDFYATYVAWSCSIKLRSGESLEVSKSLKQGAELTEVAIQSEKIIPYDL